VAELHEEQLFKDVEPDECPLCFQPMPLETYSSTFKSCCGKLICNGCMYAMKISEGKDLCPFCRTTPPSSDEEENNRIKKLMDKGNAEAFNMVALEYDSGGAGLPQDHRKANELYFKAGELGSANGYRNLGMSYSDGEGVEVDKKKAQYYYELAAMMGDTHARHNLGCYEWNKGNKHRAYKHFIIAARAGDKDSVHTVKKGFMNGLVTKDEYANTLRSYHERQQEMKSEMRDKAAAARKQED